MIFNAYVETCPVEITKTVFTQTVAEPHEDGHVYHRLVTIENPNKGLKYSDFSLTNILSTGSTDLLFNISSITSPSLQMSDSLETVASNISNFINTTNG